MHFEGRKQLFSRLDYIEINQGINVKVIYLISMSNSKENLQKKSTSTEVKRGYTSHCLQVKRKNWEWFSCFSLFRFANYYLGCEKCET